MPAVRRHGRRAGAERDDPAAATIPPPAAAQRQAQDARCRLARARRADADGKARSLRREAAEGSSALEAAPRTTPAWPRPRHDHARIELEKIDRVVNMVGELVIAQAMLGQIVHDLPEATSGRLRQILDEVMHHTRELKDSVMSMRAQPVGAVFQRMPRLVRELSTKTAKKVRLEMSGETTEVDRSIIERLSDPLTHIIRNSVDHGIESPADRLAAGKNEEGTIHLSRRASRRPDRHRDPRRRRRHQLRARAQEGARARTRRPGCHAHRRRDQQPDHGAGILDRGDDLRHFRPRRRHGRRAQQHPGYRRTDLAQVGAWPRHDDHSSRCR